MEKRKSNVFRFFLCVLVLLGAQAFTHVQAQEFHIYGMRALGMGGAGVAAVRDVTSIYWNPAAQGFFEKEQSDVEAEYSRSGGILGLQAGLRQHEEFGAHVDRVIELGIEDLADDPVGFLFPNGTVITPDGGTLIVGESFGARLTAFDVAPDGALSNRRIWAQLEKAVPDGICLDAEGGIWVASPVSAEVLRVREGGEVSDRVSVQTQAFACMLGGPERRTLFICTAADSDPAKTATRSGHIESVEVEVPGAGLP